MLASSIIFIAISLTLCEANSIHREPELQNVVPGSQQSGCSRGTRHFEKGSVQSEGGVSCTCQGDDQWTCVQETDVLTCRLGSKIYRDGQTVSEGSMTCTCSNGVWACPGFEEKPPEAMCKVGNRNYNEGETYTEGGLTCTCSEGSWKCPTK